MLLPSWRVQSANCLTSGRAGSGALSIVPVAWGTTCSLRGQGRDSLPPLVILPDHPHAVFLSWVPPAPGDIWFVVRQGRVPVGGKTALATAPATAPAVCHGHVWLNGWSCGVQMAIALLPILQQRTGEPLAQQAPRSREKDRSGWRFTGSPAAKTKAEPSFPGTTCPTQTWLCLHLCGERGISHAGMARILNFYLWHTGNTFMYCFLLNIYQDKMAHFITSSKYYAKGKFGQRSYHAKPGSTGPRHHCPAEKLFL